MGSGTCRRRRRRDAEAAESATDERECVSASGDEGDSAGERASHVSGSTQAAVSSSGAGESESRSGNERHGRTDEWVETINESNELNDWEGKRK